QETIYEASSLTMHTLARAQLEEAAAAGEPMEWVALIEPVRDVTGFPWLHLEVQPASIVTHPEELIGRPPTTIGPPVSTERVYRDVGQLREAMAARS
ncbi:MAG TPA: hypothetical protein VFF24_09025, partial [Acidimicrobiia bacterium]|nr:hypothetical protein [Acidimicrobiia bacterium]